MIDLKRLQTIQKISQIVAVASLVVFAVLISASVSRLRSISRQEEELREQVSQLTATRDRLNLEIEAKKKEVAALRKTAVDFSQDVLARTAPTEAKQILDEAIESNPQAAQVIPRVYLHIRDEAQREKAQQIADLVKEAGFLIPYIENVGLQSPSRTELRYFRKEHLEDVRGIEALLKRAHVEAVVKYIPGYETSKKIRPRHYEIFFGPEF